jgi:hypothetical protein
MSDHPARTPWTLSDALPLIVKLASELAPDYHLALAGSVLLRGASDKDLDLVVYPNSTVVQDKAVVEAALRRVGLARMYDVEVMHARWRRVGSTDTKHVEIWDYRGRRVDVIYLP